LGYGHGESEVTYYTISTSNSYSSGEVNMSDITIMVPFDVVSALRLPPDTIQTELQHELALAALSAGYPLFRESMCSCAGVNRWEWEALSGARKIPRHYTDEELNQDIAYATGGQ